MRGRLRIHFTSDDLAKVRVAQGPDPLWELVLSAYNLRDPGPLLDLGSWRSSARRTLARQPLPDGVRMLAELTQPGAFPDFLTPLEAAGSLDDGIEAIASTPRRLLHNDISHIGTQRRLPAWTRDLADGDPRLLTTLCDGMRSYFGLLLQPHWQTVRTHVDAERARKAQAFLDGGCEQVLSELRPLATWTRPVLEAPYMTSRDIHLDGRGLLLVPSYFCWGEPVTFIDAMNPVPLLVYPVEHDLTRPGTALAPLIGQTRADLLSVLAEGRFTTGELARRLNVSAGNISQHTRVLREAGLIASTRHGNLVLHSAAPLGRQLLN